MPMYMPPLRPYQILDDSEIAHHLAAGRNVLYVLPTAGGKTLVFTRSVARAAAAGQKTMVLVHRWELMKQASQKLFQLGLPHGLVIPGRPLTHNNIYVASVDTLHARLSEYQSWLRTMDFVAIDEAHHIPAPKFAGVVGAMENALRLGATATPYRTDGVRLDGFFDVAVEGMFVSDLMAMGYHARIDIYQPPLHLDLRKLLANLPERDSDFAPEALAKVLDRPEVTELMVKYYALLGGGQPGIFFCCTVDHAEHVAAQFSAAGFRAASVDGTMSEGDRTRRIKGIENGNIQVLTSCDLVSEGVDIPALVFGGSLRPTKSLSRHKQQLGRVGRVLAGKTHSIWVDLVRNVGKHGLPDEDPEWSLAEGLIAPPVSRVRRCKLCFAVVRDAPGLCRCPRCDNALPPSAIEEEEPTPTRKDVAPPTSLMALSDADIRAWPLKQLMRLVRDSRDIDRIARVRGYKKGWAWNKKVAFGFIKPSRYKDDRTITAI